MYKIAVKTDSLVTPGINACQGCALELIMRNVLDVLGRDTVLIIPPPAVRRCSPAAGSRAA